MMTDDERRAVLIATRLLPASGTCHARTVYREGSSEIIWCNADAVGQWPNGGQYCATHLAELDAWADAHLGG